MEADEKDKLPEVELLGQMTCVLPYNIGVAVPRLTISTAF